MFNQVVLDDQFAVLGEADRLAASPGGRVMEPCCPGVRYHKLRAVRRRSGFIVPGLSWWLGK
jgi:hypothetical protein